MIRIPGRIPITIHTTFWIFAALIGYLNSMSFFGTIIWVGVIFISILFHEFGHALTARFFGQTPQIELVALGGLTYHNGASLPFWKQFFIVLNGPIFGFLLFGIASFLLQIPQFSVGLTASILQLTRAVNLFWTFVNLLPVMPLDGGQLLRIVLEKIFGLKGFKYSLIVGMAVGLGIGLVAFLFQQYFIGALFFLLAFQGYDTFRKSRHLTESDRDDKTRTLINRIEEHLQNGEKEKAEALCEEVRKKTKTGLLFALSTQYLAFLKYEKGLSQEAYQLLLSIKDDLASDALCLLHKIAFDLRDFPLVIELGTNCFQTFPSAETALRNALAHAELKHATPAIGWLQTAIQEGLVNIDEMIKAHAFDLIRQEPEFEAFLKDLHL